MNAHRKAFFKFPLDPFQEEACQAIDAGENVLVCAPTGAGKTAIAEWAIAANLGLKKRCLYTTPLKALSNQKFFDLCNQFGESYVGLSTGDVSVRSRAELVVMTTEVYRNMLYGTSADSEGDFSVSRVGSVILDEVHFMNDDERGTVWEESIIYTPKEIQIIGLSATVANAKEMRDWLEATHGPTRLIATDFRPVPLRHYYFRKGDLLEVFVKPKTKSGKPTINPRLLRYQGELAPRRRSGQSLADTLVDPRKLIDKMTKLDMLPVIYFVFSRKGCEKLLEETRGAISLTLSERDAIDTAILAFASHHPEILEHPDLDTLRRGTAVHHAGVLPVWKSLVENLFAQGLVKIVFATETLAAGINMPARTTVISALSKFTGEGRRSLTGSEMLQMSGRAGRRGMDSAGNVVIGAHPKEPIEMVIGLAKASPEALTSHFQPSYGMVLNLLQRRPLPAVKELLDRSFGQFIHRRRQLSLGLDPKLIGNEFQPPCPDPENPGDRKAYLKILARRRAVKQMLRELDSVLMAGPNSNSRALKSERAQLEQELAELNGLKKSSPCNRCPNYDECGELYKSLGESDKPSYWEEFKALSSVLSEAGHLVNNKPSDIGKMIAGLRASNVYAVGEALLGPVSDVADQMTTSQFAAVCCMLTSEQTRRDPRLSLPLVSRYTEPILQRILKLFDYIEDQQLDHGVDRELPRETIFCGVAEIWASGVAWPTLEGVSGLPGGDLFRILRRTYDLCRQVENWRGAPVELLALASQTCRELLRGPLEENISFFEATEGDASVLGEPQSSSALVSLPSLRPLLRSESASSQGEARGERKRITRRRNPLGGGSFRPQPGEGGPRSQNGESASPKSTRRPPSSKKKPSRRARK